MKQTLYCLLSKDRSICVVSGVSIMLVIRNTKMKKRICWYYDEIGQLAIPLVWYACIYGVE